MSDAPSDSVLRAVLEALEMPPAGVRTWLEQNKALCERHGGRPHYSELLDLYESGWCSSGRR